MPSPFVIPAPGARIEVRDAEWLVRRVDRLAADCYAVRALGISEIVRNKEAVFLSDIDADMRILDPAETKLVPDTSQGFQASLLYMESLLRQTPPTDDNLYIGHRAVMDLNPFQLDPAIQALRHPRQRILIADAVGLGKTLEAGILMAELIRRGRGRRILVLTTKSMLAQFQKELWSRFTIPLTRLDSVGIQRLRQRLPTNQNPFYHHDKVIISIDTLKQDTEYRAWLENARWDIIVIDEAHNVAERGAGRSLRARLARLLSGCSDTLIMLSATPHDGRPQSFASLMNMLDPTAIANPKEYSPEDIKGLYIRRFKKDIADQVATAFKERKIASLECPATPPEERLFDALTACTFQRLDQNRATGTPLFRTTLEKALFSSPFAFRKTVANRIARLEAKSDRAWEQDLATLRQLDALAEPITASSFARYQRLLDLLRKPGGDFSWNPGNSRDRLVIFTERLETLTFLEQQLPTDLGLQATQVTRLDGGMADIEQQKIVEEFGREESPIRLLLASDVASEGLNLHFLCHRLIHFDIPWSLMTFQQRNGRIDRYGQPEEPRILYLVGLSDNAKIRGDTRILQVLIEKDQYAARNIGDPSAMMGVYDIDLEETRTAEAIEQGVSAEAFASSLTAEEFNPLDVLLAQNDSPTGNTAAAACRQPLSLFPDDFAYARMALTFLQREGDLTSKVRSDGRLIELQPPPDLMVRFRPFPPEVLPQDGLLRLTDDVGRIKEEIVRSRREERAWPHLQYLWPLHPAMEWLNDRLQAAFRRHEAPVLLLEGKLAPGERIYVLSGLIPNLQGQPLIHRWVGVCTQGRRIDRVEPFPETAERLQLGRQAVPNPGRPIDPIPLQNLLPVVVEKATEWVGGRRREFEGALRPRLNELLARLKTLKDRQVRQLALDATLSAARREERRRAIDRTFEEHQRWVHDAMTTEEKPYIQVVAVLIGPEAV